MLNFGHVSTEKCVVFLSQLELGEFSSVPGANAASAADSPKQLRGASPVPGLPGAKEDFVIESPVSAPNVPVAWYKFDGNAYDSAGNAHGSPRGSPTYVRGVYGQAISLDGYEDSVQARAAANLFSNISTGITIAFWQYGATSTHHRDTLCCSDYADRLDHPAITINLGCWELPGEYNWNCGQPGSSGYRLTGQHRHQSEWSGRWNHWAFTKDVRAGKMQIFLNGKLFDSHASAHSPISGITSFEIGSGWYGSYDGLIDDFRIYDYALSRSQIVHVATNGTGIFRQPLTNEADTFATGIEDALARPNGQTSAKTVRPPGTRSAQMLGRGSQRRRLNPPEPDRAGTESSLPSQETASKDRRAQGIISVTSPPLADDSSVGVPKTLRVVLRPVKDIRDEGPTVAASRSAEFENGEDILDLDFPETITMMQLLELAGEYLDLDYVYNPRVVGNQTVTLKLRGSLGGEMKVRDLYTILETVLKFNGLALTRRGEKLVTIVPVAQALDTDPRLVDDASNPVQAGDMLVTRVFEVQHVDVTSVAELLQSMKLGTAVLPSEEAQILFVTCYAHRMDRIEQLVNMLDRPGRTRECRFRRLQHTTASALADKVRILSDEIQGVPIAGTSLVGKSPPQQATGPTGSKAPVSGAGRQVYLDSDERTNRVVMVGHEEQLEFVEELIDVLDVAQEDLRTAKTYDVKHMEAQEVLSKLQELEVLGRPNASAGSSAFPALAAAPGASPSSKADTTRSAVLTEEAIVAVLEATNQLLVRATQEQHARIDEFLGYVDVMPEDAQALQVYEIQHVDAEEVRTKLEELDVIGVRPSGSRRIAPPTLRTNSVAARRTNPQGVRPLTTNTVRTADALLERPQVVVTESTNSLLVNATAEQHARIATIIHYVDRELPEEDIPYRIYPLENSSPEHVADILQRLIQEAVQDKEDKIERVVKREQQITIVPDPNTFSLIVYASRKNQQWIEKLAKSLDKRRPQVLIDVTLVEITRAETFEYDLNIVASAEEAVIGSIGIEPIHRINSKSLLEGSFNLLDQEGNPTGQTKAFYSDQKVQALLTAIKRKNYGRVLAKPKILVDDGQEGEISTTDETTYLKESVQVPDQGSPITTRDFVPIEAKIQLQITPHISEGDLLRLDVHLSRGDFGTRPAEGAPPDKTTSEVTTTVFVPDSHTVILGGLVKLNQSKGGSKVPILGDIPLIGALFRSVDNSDVEKKLYVFLKANIVRPYEEAKIVDLQKISEGHRKAFEKSEAEFQKHEDMPGIAPKPMRPERVLEEP
jgi:type II secretory pathway component GspD/PulD (secretin)